MDANPESSSTSQPDQSEDASETRAAVAGEDTTLPKGERKIHGRKLYGIIGRLFLLCVLVIGFLFAMASRQMAPNGPSKQLIANASEFYSNAVEFAQHGVTGAFPVMKPTGNVWEDRLARDVQELFQTVAFTIFAMSQQIESLQKRSALSAYVITNRLQIEAEIQKRMEALRILADGRTNLPAVIEAFRQRIWQRSFSGEPHLGMQGFDEAIRQSAPYYQEMFQVLERKEQADLEFLLFMETAQGDFHVEGNHILFDSETNRVNYNELSAGVIRADRDRANFRAKAIEKARDRIGQYNK